MRRLCIALLFIALGATWTSPATIELTVAKKMKLKGQLEDLVTFGLLKEMTCTPGGDIFSPSNRKYGSAINSVVRFPRDARSYTKFSIDELPLLKDGTITDFDLGPNGELYALARQV